MFPPWNLDNLLIDGYLFSNADRLYLSMITSQHDIEVYRK